MDKKLKQQIKDDEFRSGLQHAWEFAKKNRQATQTAAIAIVAAVALVWGFVTWQRGRSSQAEAALQAALDVFEAPLAGQESPQSPKPAAIYDTAQQKFTKALAAFEDVEKKYGSLPAGRRARFFAAVSRLQLGQTAEARKALETIAAETNADSLEPTLARLTLAQSFVGSGEMDKGIDLFRKLAEQPTLPLSRDYVLMELAGALERSGRTDEARAFFRRVADEFPDGAQAAEANRRLQSL